MNISKNNKYTAANRIVTLFLLLISLLLVVSADKPFMEEGRMTSVPVDNEFIQTYKGRIGRWILPGREKISDIAIGLGSSVDEIRSINDNSIQASSYLFVPMSEDVYNGLLARGYGRRIFQLDSRKYVWPIETPVYSSRFGRRGRGVHLGLDIICQKDTVVVSANDGVVEDTGWMGGMGKAIKIVHKDGMVSWYGHNSVILVKKGDEVRRGQIISRSGNTGMSTGPHLHFEVRFMDVPLNPEDFLPYGFRNADLVLRETPGNGFGNSENKSAMVLDQEKMLH